MVNIIHFYIQKNQQQNDQNKLPMTINAEVSIDCIRAGAQMSLQIMSQLNPSYPVVFVCMQSSKEFPSC